MERPLIYIVDDDRDIQSAISEVLSQDGYEVRCYNNGREAAEALEKSESPNLILLDWMMPIMNGEAFVKQEGETLRRREIPVVVVSAMADWIGKVPGVQEKIAKPMEINELLDVVSRNCHSA